MTPRFLSDRPRVEFLEDGETVRLCSEIIFQDSTGRLWTASPGKVSDGASIPSFLWVWLGSPFTGFHRDAALLHDDAAYLFAPPEEASLWAAQCSKERRAADAMLWEATVVRINEAKLSWLLHARAMFHANAIYSGLRIGGAPAWAQHARQNAAA